MGLKLETYANINGLLICFIALKFLNFIKRLNHGTGLLFDVMGAIEHELSYLCFIIAYTLISLSTMFRVAFGGNFRPFNT